jgi:hypothetical protein
MNIQKISVIFGRKRRVLLVILILLVSLLSTVPAIPALADGTTSIIITKYAGDHATILDQITLDYQTMEALLPVQGDGVTHQYLQGPVFEGDIWDLGETVNIKDWGANKGTDLMDLCELVGGMSYGDTVEIKASDGLARTYDYPNIYTPDPRQGKMAICWWCDGKYVPAWQDGMRLVFFAETTNPDGFYVFGNWDQYECFPENRWYYYSGQYPTTTGHSVKYIDEINIYSNQITEYNLTVSVSGSGTTSPSPGVHSFAQGTVVNINATPASGWQFSNWTGSGIANPDSAITTVTLDGDKTIIANFNRITQNYDLTIENRGSGTTTPSAGVHSYARDSVVDITAIPASGWRFVKWTGSGIANPDSVTTTVTMNVDRTITASFTQITQNYDLTISVSGSGITTPSAGINSYSQGTMVNITAIPDGGWHFVSWTGSGIANPDSVTTTVTMNEDKTIIANFTQITRNYNLTIEISGDGTTSPSAGINSYSQGTMINITAVPEGDWQFVKWIGNVADPDSANTTVVMDADKNIIAEFAQEITGKVASFEIPEATLKLDKAPQEIPWYIILAIAGGITATMLLLVIIIRDIRGSRIR